LSGHIESTDLTNDVNGGPSGIGIATAAGKAAFWDIVGAPMGTPKVIALEGEFAMTEGHAQELRPQAIALQVGKRLRILLSDSNAGIDDSLIGGVVSSKFTGYRLVDQWTSYGWNVLSIPDGHDYDQIVGALRTMEAWDPADRRPMIVIGTTTKGYWPGAVNGKIPGAGDQVVGYPSHPYGMKMNSEYFVALARTFEARYGVEFQGISQGPVTDPRERLKIALFRKAGETAGARRAVSEIVKWLNHVTDNRVLTLAADLSESINLEHGSIWGHYDPEANPLGTRLKAAIEEAGNVSSAIGLVGQSASLDPDQFAGVWAFSGTYGAFTPLMYLPARVWSQQNQDSK